MLTRLSHCLHVFLKSGNRSLSLFTLLSEGHRQEDFIVCIMLYICKERHLFGDHILQKEKKKKGKTAVTLRDSLDVNKEALAKVCKCHNI